jgi:hypothetical protein
MDTRKGYPYGMHVIVPITTVGVVVEFSLTLSF